MRCWNAVCNPEYTSIDNWIVSSLKLLSSNSYTLLYNQLPHSYIHYSSHPSLHQHLQATSVSSRSILSQWAVEDTTHPQAKATNLTSHLATEVVEACAMSSQTGRVTGNTNLEPQMGMKRES